MYILLLLTIVLMTIKNSIKKNTEEYFDNSTNDSINNSIFPPKYEPDIWNDSSVIKTNNCYAYVLNNLKMRSKKPQPGIFAGIFKKDDYKSCDETFDRVKKDNPEIYKISSTESCKDGFYKGYLAMDPGKDYHFYRQDANGFWSHKPGKSAVTNLDSSGNKIVNPSIANRIYKQFKYTKECNYMCIPKNTNAD